MNCLESQELLQRRLDGEAIAGEALEHHLNVCAKCREEHAAASRLLEGIENLPAPMPSADLVQRIVSEVVSDRQNRREKLRRRVVLTLALAASVLFMLLAAYYWIPNNRQPIPSQPLVNQDPKKSPDPDKKDVPDRQKVEPKNALAALPDRLADSTRDHVKVVEVAMNLDAVKKLPVGDIPALDPGIEEVTSGVRTVTFNTRKAFEFFARELPMPEMREQK